MGAGDLAVARNSIGTRRGTRAQYNMLKGDIAVRTSRTDISDLISDKTVAVLGVGCAGRQMRSILKLQRRFVLSSIKSSSPWLSGRPVA